jgi:mucolipin 3
VNVSASLDYTLDRTLETTCLLVPPALNASTRSWLAATHGGHDPDWAAIETLVLAFNLSTVAIGPQGGITGGPPDCFQLAVRILFDNRDHDGQVLLGLELTPHRLDCPVPVAVDGGFSNSNNLVAQLVLALNCTVLAVCAASLLLCLRALLRAQLLRHETEDLLLARYGWRLTAGERLEFLNLWYVMICANDALIILASLAKLAIELHLASGELWDLTSLLLGTGALLVWFGLLRYLGFFRTYNVLILTMKGAAPNILRFLLCAGLLYAGFALAGWLILGPYHYKFSSLMTTSETLFSLINGDDMFASFDAFPRDKALAVWVYSRVYLYLFVCLFTYVVLSLFISIIMDTYEIIKHCYERGFPVTR